MSASAARLVEQVVDNARYPLRDPSGTGWRDVVSRVRQDLHTVGCSVLPDFVRPALREALRRECEEIAPRAYYDARRSTRTIPTRTRLCGRSSGPDDDRARQRVRCARLHPRRAHHPPALHSRCSSSSSPGALRCPQVHELADPLSGLCLNVIAPGRAHPWHFEHERVHGQHGHPGAGGGWRVRILPEYRSARAENFEDVRAVLAGRGEHLIRRLALRPGYLQLFTAATPCTA